MSKRKSKVKSVLSFVAFLIVTIPIWIPVALSLIGGVCEDLVDLYDETVNERFRKWNNKWNPLKEGESHE